MLRILIPLYLSLTCTGVFAQSGTVTTPLPGVPDRYYEALSWADDGRIYCPDWVHGVLYQINLEDGTADTLLSGLSTPLGGTFGDDGTYYFSEAGTGSLHRYTPADGDSIIATGLGQPTGNYFEAASNRVLVNDFGFNRLLAVHLADGRVETLIDSLDAVGLNGPDGIVPAHGGGYLIANFNDSLIHHLAEDGEVTRFATIRTRTNTGYLIPFRDGYLVTVYGGGRIDFISGVGVVSRWAGSGRRAINDGNLLDTVGFNIPNGIAINPAGDSIVVSENFSIGQIRLITGFDIATSVGGMPPGPLAGVGLFPQPALDGWVVTRLVTRQSGELGAILYDSFGRGVREYPRRSVSKGEVTERWEMPAGLPGGTYYLRLILDGTQRTLPLLIGKK